MEQDQITFTQAVQLRDAIIGNKHQISNAITKEDYDLIYKYYNSFINSVEVRLMMNLFYSVPKQSRSRINLSALFKKTSHKQSTYKQSTHKQSTSNT